MKIYICEKSEDDKKMANNNKFNGMWGFRVLMRGPDGCLRWWTLRTDKEITEIQRKWDARKQRQVLRGEIQEFNPPTTTKRL